MSICYYYPNAAWGNDMGHHGFHLLGLYTRHLFHGFLTVIPWCRHCYYLLFKDEDTGPNITQMAAVEPGFHAGRPAPPSMRFPSPAHGLCGEESVKGFPEHLRLCEAREKLLWVLSHLWISCYNGYSHHPRHPTWKGGQNGKVTRLEHMIPQITWRVTGFRT